jgi:hypothetical protein
MKEFKRNVGPLQNFVDEKRRLIKEFISAGKPPEHVPQPEPQLLAEEVEVHQIQT